MNKPFAVGSVWLALLSVLACVVAAERPAGAVDRPNILIITVDDMNADSIGAFGCRLPGTTPAIDQLAESGLRFQFAHVQVGNCMPGRNVMWSGRYPHNNRVEGFYPVTDPNYPHLVDLMKSAGYFTAVRGKASHSTPYHPYAWDRILDTGADGEKYHVKNPASYGVSTRRGIVAAQESGKPFCLMINVADPHKPFYGQGAGGRAGSDSHVPSRVFTASEVPVPGFLFDDPVVRKELALYYSSVRRADDCVREVLRALRDSGKEESTFVLFLSDHGMPFPFAKTQLYHHSTRTPLIVRWPRVTRAGSQDRTHMVSAVDLLPTLLDVAGIGHPDGLDGRSFAPLIRGGVQSGRDFVIKEYNENSGASRDPMRAVQTRRYLYIFNPWSNGQRVMATATTGTQTYRRMAELAKTDPRLGARNRLYRYRVLEELFDVTNDPDCLTNLVETSAHSDELGRLRQVLDDSMSATSDPLLGVFRRRNDATFREASIVNQEDKAQARRTARRRNRENSANAKPQP